MSHYIELEVLPDPEFTPPVLMSALFSKLHRQLAHEQWTDVGVSFPGYSTAPRSLGSVLRLHSTPQRLETLMATDWLRGVSEHTATSDINPVPADAEHRVFKRRQFKTNVERLRRRRMKRHGETYEQAADAIPSKVEQTPSLPFLVLRSQSTRQRFHCFIEQSAPQTEPVPGTFNAYGLSDHATVPCF